MRDAQEMFLTNLRGLISIMADRFYGRHDNYEVSKSLLCDARTRVEKALDGESNEVAFIVAANIIVHIISSER